MIQQLKYIYIIKIINVITRWTFLIKQNVFCTDLMLSFFLTKREEGIEKKNEEGKENEFF